ncbi:unnamed protein product [Absidia cylindrospora]
MTTTTTTTTTTYQQPINNSTSDHSSVSFENEYTIEEDCSTCSNENQHQHAFVQKDFIPTFYNPFETKHRRRTSRAQFKLLETSFYENTKPNATMRRWLAQKLGMTPRSVQVWFQNRRAKAKSQLKRQYSSSSSSSFDYEEDDRHPSDQYNSRSINNTCSCFVPSTDQNHCCQNNQQQQYQCSPLTPLSCFSPPINDDVHQWQLTCDPLSILMNQQQHHSPSDLSPWYPTSSPISSPLPSSLNNAYYHHNTVPFDPITMHKEPFHRLSEPIFDLQSSPIMMIPQQQLDPFNDASFL